jgi:hypothetical protein
MAQFCKKCGAEIPQGSSFCPQCGEPIGALEGASIGLKIVSFLFPIIGWILYFVYKSENIKKAKDCGMWGLIGFGVGLLITIVGGVG